MSLYNFIITAQQEWKGKGNVGHAEVLIGLYVFWSTHLIQIWNVRCYKQIEHEYGSPVVR